MKKKTPGTPGTEGKTLIESTASQFPVKKRKPGTPGTWTGLCERPSSSPNRVGPQRADGWTGGLTAVLAPKLAPAGEPSPISPAGVRANVERELRVLAALGRKEPAALRDAIGITRAKIRNSPALAETQTNSGRCFVCDEVNGGDRPVIAVLSRNLNGAVYLHAACHTEHERRMAEKVEQVMAAAGYGDADRVMAAAGNDAAPSGVK